MGARINANFQGMRQDVWLKLRPASYFKTDPSPISKQTDIIRKFHHLPDVAALEDKVRMDSTKKASGKFPLAF